MVGLAIFGIGYISMKFDWRKEAKQLTKRLRTTVEDTQQLEQLIPILMQRTVEQIEKAEYEYKCNAYGPFWDAIEEAVKNLGEYDKTLKHISLNVNRYYKELENKRHDFPTDLVQENRLPEIDHILTDFGKVVRMGETEPDFAKIWEMRKMQKILIVGFKTLGEAINNISDVLSSSFSNLQSSISEGISKMTEKEIATHKAIVEESYKTRKTIRDPKSTYD